MILSFFETMDVLPHVNSTSLLVDGYVVEMTQDEEKLLQEQVELLFKDSRTMNCQVRSYPFQNQYICIVH